MKIRHAAVAVVAFSMACSVPTLPLNVHQLSTREAIAQSSTILVGVVQGISLSGDSHRTVEGVRVRTWRVEVKPYSVLKGATEGQIVTFLFNNYDPHEVQNGNFEWLRVGDRRVFFLAAQGTTLRSVSDLYKTSIVFPHAVLPTVPRSREEPMGNRIATLLLERAPGESPQDFAQMIPKATTEALRSAGYEFVSVLLRRMEASELHDVRIEACLTAYEQAFGGDSCMVELEAGNIAPEVSQRVLKARERRAYLRQLASRALNEGHECPLLNYTYGVEPDDPVSVAGYLRFMAQQNDPILRACAKKQLGE